MKGQDISCYLGRISIADRTYFNDVLIGTEGYFPPHEFTAWNTARFYEIPESIVNWDGKNTILIQIYVDGEGSIVSHPYIGLHDNAKFSAANERFWNSQINLLFAFFMLVIAAYELMIWNKNRKEKSSIYFAFINIFSVLYMVVFYIPEIPGLLNEHLSFIWFQKIFSSAMPFALPFIITTFVNNFLHRKEPKVMMIIRVLFFVMPVAVIITAPDYVHLRSWRNVYQPFLVPPIAYCLFILAKAVFKKEKNAVPLLWGFSPLMITVIFDVFIHDWLKIYSMPYLSSIGWQLVIIALLFVLANSFANAKNEAEYLNIHLADEVEERTKELTESNNQLSVANEELEAARARAEADMKLAVYVQQSYFPRQAPFVDDWDIAYTFNPAAGVSGDLYDFYSENRKLTGVALFDVSGHGISSGLVTMLAKNAISRTFTSDMNVKLGTVMKNFNDRIVADKGNVENYLTGVLMRFSDTKVQLINAGHPSVFYKSVKTGKCIAIQKTGETSGKSNACSLIGFGDLNVDFKALQFNVESGDAIILYTDCLSESKNKSGDMFTEERIRTVFNQSGEGTAKEKLDYVLQNFKNFTEGVAAKDDLTVIVIQKK